MNNSRALAFWQLGLAGLLSLCLTFFVLRGGWSLGFFLAVLLTEGLFLLWLRLPTNTAAAEEPQTPAQKPGLTFPTALQIALALIILDLGLCFLLYDNLPLKVINALMILPLIALQFQLGSRIFLQDWDRPLFWVEGVISVIARPWVCLGDFGRQLLNLLSRSIPGQRPADSASDEDELPAAPRRALIWKILLGILLAIPVLLIAGSLLAAADAVFAQLFVSLQDFLTQLSLSEIFKILLTAVLILPFIFSFLYSGYKRWRLVASPDHYSSQTKGLRIDKTILITFLTCINILYLLFAVIQAAYLTGAFTARLPENLTYAEYARSGFFELAFVSAINLGLILLAVKAADRKGIAGLILRVESLLLIAGSLVQWLSAMFRMYLYINTYGLTYLRFMVTAFMLLLLVLFAFLLVKEFLPRLPLFKMLAATTLISLLVLNHVNSDRWIASFNVQHYAATGKVDVSYYRELSNSAVTALLELSRSADPVVAGEAAGQLLRRYAGSLAHDENWRWQAYNISNERAGRLIAADLDRLKALNPSVAADLN